MQLDCNYVAYGSSLIMPIKWNACVKMKFQIVVSLYQMFFGFICNFFINEESIYQSKQGEKGRKRF